MVVMNAWAGFSGADFHLRRALEGFPLLQRLGGEFEFAHFHSKRILVVESNNVPSTLEILRFLDRPARWSLRGWGWCEEVSELLAKR